MIWIFCRGFYLTFAFSFQALAEAAPAPKPTALEQFFPFIIIGLIFYFLLIRPQQKKLKRQEGFLSRLKRGDEVVTSSGIFGRIEGLTEQFVILEVAENVRIRVLKSRIGSFVKELSDDREKKPENKKRKA